MIRRFISFARQYRNYEIEHGIKLENLKEVSFIGKSRLLKQFIFEVMDEEFYKQIKDSPHIITISEEGMSGHIFGFKINKE